MTERTGVGNRIRRFWHGPENPGGPEARKDVPTQTAQSIGERAEFAYRLGTLEAGQEPLVPFEKRHAAQEAYQAELDRIMRDALDVTGSARTK